MRPIGPRVLATQPVTDTPIILDLYESGTPRFSMLVDEAALGTLVYVVEFIIQNPFDPPANLLWQTFGAGTLVGTVRNFPLPAQGLATAVRVRTTGGAGSITYYVTQASNPN